MSCAHAQCVAKSVTRTSKGERAHFKSFEKEGEFSCVWVGSVLFLNFDTLLSKCVKFFVENIRQKGIPKLPIVIHLSDSL